MGWREESIKYHDKLATAVARHAGQILRTNEIAKILAKRFSEFDERENWVQPSDHCDNHTNKGACSCALTGKAIFHKIEKGKSRVR